MVYCQREITIVDLTSSDMTLAAQKQALATKPDIVVATPTKILQHLKDEQQAALLGLKTSLEMLVIDEADLLLSFGYEDDMRTLVK
jgi:ATP-dependent RNA helicase DDX56/DBP9